MALVRVQKELEIFEMKNCRTTIMQEELQLSHDNMTRCWCKGTQRGVFFSVEVTQLSTSFLIFLPKKPSPCFLWVLAIKQYAFSKGFRKGEKSTPE